MSTDFRQEWNLAEKCIECIGRKYIERDVTTGEGLQVLYSHQRILQTEPQQWRSSCVMVLFGWWKFLLRVLIRLFSEGIVVLSCVSLLTQLFQISCNQLIFKGHCFTLPAAARFTHKPPRNLCTRACIASLAKVFFFCCCFPFSSVPVSLFFLLRHLLFFPSRVCCHFLFLAINYHSESAPGSPLIFMWHHGLKTKDRQCLISLQLLQV